MTSVRLGTILCRSRPKPRTRHGLYALVGYTYARNFDSGFKDGVGTSSGATYFPCRNYRADWALSQIQLNHNFTASVIYELPFGKGKRFGSSWNGGVNAVLGNWQVNVIEKITSGFPIFIDRQQQQFRRNLTNNGNNFNRPDQVCSPKADNPTLSKWFNTQCFVDPASGGTRECFPSPALRTGLCEYRFLDHQAHPPVLP